MDDSRLKLLCTVESVVEAFGGGSAAARAVGCSPQTITNAIARGRLPHPTFLIFADQLRRRGYRARPELWGIKRVSADPRRWGIKPVKRRV